MRARILSLFFITASIFLLFLMWRINSLFYSKQSESQTYVLRSHVLSLNYALQAEVQNLSERLESFENMSSTAIQMKMLLKFSDTNGWEVEKKTLSESSPLASWIDSHLTLFLKSYKVDDFKDGESYVFTLLDPQRKPFLLFLFPSQKAGVLKGLITKSEIFQSGLDKQKGMKSQFFLVNSLGQVLAHTTSEYIGTQIQDEPLVKEIIQTGNSSGSGAYNSIQADSYLGVFEQIERSNLYVVATQDSKITFKGQKVLILQILLSGIGVIFFALAALYLFLSKMLSDQNHSAPLENKNLNETRAVQVETFALREIPDPVVESSGILAPPVTDSAGYSEMLTAPAQASVPAAHTPGLSRAEGALLSSGVESYTQVASALSHELNGPLTFLLGNIQILKTKEIVKDPLDQKLLVEMETQARLARDVIQKLLIFSGEDQFKIQPARVDEILEQALKKIETKVLINGIDLKKNIPTKIPEFSFVPEFITKAIDQVLLNAVEAMDAIKDSNHKKELNIDLQVTETMVVLKISDTGIGIKESLLSQVFNPFYTTKSDQHHLGLGLSAALGILRQINGSIELTSQEGKGTQVFISFPLKKDLQNTALIAPKAPPPAKLKSAVTEHQVVNNTVSFPPPPKPLEMPSFLDDKKIQEALGMLDKVDDLPEPAPPSPPQPPNSPGPDFELLGEEKKTNQQAEIIIEKPKLNLPPRASPLNQVVTQIRRPLSSSSNKTSQKYSEVKRDIK